MLISISCHWNLCRFCVQSGFMTTWRHILRDEIVRILYVFCGFVRIPYSYRCPLLGADRCRCWNQKQLCYCLHSFGCISTQRWITWERQGFGDQSNWLHTFYHVTYNVMCVCHIFSIHHVLCNFPRHLWSLLKMFGMIWRSGPVWSMLKSGFVPHSDLIRTNEDRWTCTS